jgi:hypothetical protein
VCAGSNPIDGSPGGSSDPGEVLRRLRVHIIDRLESGGTINLTRAASPQVWLRLLTLSPFRSAAINTTVDTVAEVLRAHHISALSIQALSTDATDGPRSESTARTLLVRALKPRHAKRHGRKPSTRRHVKRRLDPASVAARQPAEVRDLMLALISLGQHARHQRRP